jgi:signal transduction histidine kinase
MGPTHAARLADLSALDVYVAAVAAMMALIAMALWIASNITDRVALRLFALRYLLAVPGWVFAHPRAMGPPGDVPLASGYVGIALTLLTMCALEKYVGRLTLRRGLVLVAAGVAAALAFTLVLRLAPRDPRLLYLVLAAGMTYCAVVAWQAAQRERNMGHGLIAAAFASYPALVVAILLWSPDVPGQEIGYAAALPAIVVGIAMLVASLVRFGHRLEAELARRLAAERAVRELNAGLENRIAERTAELRLIVDGLEGFTRHVSHDLRGPLAGVAGLARMAQEALARREVARAERLLEPIATQTDRLVDLVNDLATLTRLQDQLPRREPRPMRPIVDEAVAQLALAPDTAAMLKMVDLRVDDLPSASVDAGLMRQVFVNLLGNALRFATQARTPPAGLGPATAAMAATRATEPAPPAPVVHVGATTEGDKVSFFVADTGPGFPPERAGELFRPFSCMHAEGLSRNGIGLSIVRRIVEAHGGKVWAESRPGRGATFRFAVDVAGGGRG